MLDTSDLMVYDPHATRQRFSNWPFTRDEVLELLAGITDERDRLICEFGIATGCRVNEMASLRVDKVDYHNNIVTFWDDKKNKYRGSRKTGARVKYAEGRWRTQIVPPAIMARLRDWQRRNVNEDQVLFWNLSYKTLERIVERWTKQVLQKEKRWHCFRDTYVSLCRASGKSLEFVMNQTGDTGKVLLDRYSKLTPEQIEREAERPIF